MKYLNKLIFLILTIGLFSCADLEEHPIGVITPESFFANEIDVKSAILGLYNTPTASGVYGENMYVDILSDEYDVDPSTFRPYRFLFNEYRFTANDYRDKTEYFIAFSQIAYANMILSKIDGADMLDELKEQYKAEALFVRSLVYFFLVRLHGDVPYLETTMADPGDGASLNRTPAEEIYQSIITDLNWCIDYLPNSYPGDVRNRATQGSALTLLSKIHLTLATYNQVYEGAYEYRTIDKELIESLKGSYASHWEAAADYATRVINDKSKYGYELVEDFQDLFNGEIGDTKEHIFSLDYYAEAFGGNVSGGIEGWRNNNNGLTPLRKPSDVGGWSAIVPPMDLYNFFIEKDYRRYVSFETNFVLTTAPVDGDTTEQIAYSALEEAMLPVPHCAKWTRYPGQCIGWPTGSGNSMNIAIFRYGEVLLIAAEALNEMGRTDEAIGYMNQLRERARVGGVLHTPQDTVGAEIPLDIPQGLSQQECWKAIRDERQYELAFEWKRWYDLVRRDSLVAVMGRFVPSKSGVATSVQEHHKLLPIIQSEIDLCPNYIQNKGY